MHRSHRRTTSRVCRSSIATTRRALIEAVEARRLFAVNLVFDYTYDTGGFFTDPARRALLQQAADNITSDMSDTLTAITPGGTETWFATFNHPTTGNPESVGDPTIPADTIIVYAGARDLPAGVLGVGGFAGYNSTGSQAFVDNIKSRGNPGALAPNPSDFAPFAGSISFDTVEPFHFGLTTTGLNSGENDFLTVAEHELMHVLGFPRADSFAERVSGGNFVGPKASALFGGPVPLEPDGAHFLEGTSVGGVEALMDPTITVGSRKTVTPLDLAALDDIGWSFAGAALPEVTLTAIDSTAAEPSTNGAYRITRSGATTSALSVNLAVSGTAVRGSDYTLVDGTTTFTGNSITIPAGASFIDITLDVRDDSTIEDNEIATLALTSSSAYTVAGTTASVTITDDDLRRLQLARAGAINVNTSTAGNPSDLGAFGMDISADGRYVTFVSNSTNLVTTPLTTYFQVYRRDLVTGVTRLVSIANGDTREANDDAFNAKISANGRFVAYETSATDIIRGVDTNFANDVYVKDMVTNQTWLVTRNRTGAVGGELVGISDDGEQVLFASVTAGSAFVKGLNDQNGGDDLFVWNRRSGRYQCITANSSGTRTGNRSTGATSQHGTATFSGDGRFVAFPSRASDLVSGVADGNTFRSDVFVRDIAARRTEYASLSTDSKKSANDNSGSPEISADGRYVIFRTAATNLLTGITDTNQTQDIYVRDRQTGTTKLVTTKIGGGGTSNGTVSEPDMTADGRFAVFTSTATNFIASDTSATSDAYLVELATGKVELLTLNSTNNGGGSAATLEVKISDDGTRAIFATLADNLPGDFDKRETDFAAVYVRNLVNDANSVISFDRNGNPSPADSSEIMISADGTRIAFSSDSETLTRVDNNGRSDLFVSATPGHEPSFLDANGKLTILGSPVDDTVNIQRVNSTIIVRRNEQRFEYRASAVKSIDVLVGDGNDSVLLGPNVQSTYVSAGSGDDTVRVGGGNDRVQGGPGRDILYGGLGNDRLDGGKGNDVVYGEGDDDNLFGGDSDDVVYGGGGTDRLRGNAGRDILDAGGSNDRFYDDDGFVDLFLGGTGTDTAVSRDSDDILDSVENT